MKIKTIVTNPIISESFYDYLYALANREPGTKIVSFPIDTIPEKVLNSDFTTDRDRQAFKDLPRNNTIIELNPLEDVFHTKHISDMTDEELIEYELRGGELNRAPTSDLSTELATRLAKVLFSSQ